MGMASEIRLPLAEERPLIQDVEAPGAVRTSTGGGRDRGERDEGILKLLRGKLRDSGHSNTYATQGAAAGEDKYEPQRLGRKICWQYDSTAHKVPLLRRHYI